MISPCTRAHVPAVVELLTGRPRQDDPDEHDRRCAYFVEVYFDNPWCQSDLPSLVSEDASGWIEGFLGLIPRPMVWRGQTVRAAITSSFRVRGPEDQGGPASPFTAARLLDALFAGPQDLAVANRANRHSRKIWESRGGATVPLYSLDWFRPIRPARSLVELGRLQAGQSLPRARRMLAEIADQVAMRTIGRLKSDVGRVYRLDDLDPGFALTVVAGAKGFDLSPSYDDGSYAWLMDQVRQKSFDDCFRAVTVKDDAGRRIGWFVYLQWRERVGEVLQMIALDGHLPTVLAAAIDDARATGMALLRGEVDPSDLLAYRDTSCLLNTGRWMLVHARQPEIVEAFVHGRARFTGLEGERWLRSFRHSPFGEHARKG